MTEVAANTAQEEYWNGRAGETWVELNRLLDMELRPLGLEAQAALSPQPGERVLDIGCGGGETSLDLAQAVSPGGARVSMPTSGSRPPTPRQRTSAAKGSTPPSPVSG
jgi:2-polyprenyl-3-methyl-5-hydroxy-6-metoxy-1,4-benzoquinol methylase